MVYFDLKRQNAECPPPRCASAVALGIFDGVHVGHAELLKETVKQRDALRAQGIPAAAVVWSLFEQPKSAIRGGAPCLTPLDEKLRLFAGFDIDYAVLDHFDEIRGLSPDGFVSGTLVDRLDCRAAVCGFNFRFGAKGRGDAQSLSSLLGRAGATVSVMPAVVRGGNVVSSSRIRLLIENGETEEAAGLLGRPFFINFPVVYGKQLGRSIGIPTINQNFPADHVIPKRGIYACTVHVGDDIFLGVNNIGVRPTVDGSGNINSETHIINYDGLLYGKRIKVSFYHRLRDEMKFASLDELRARISKDIALTKDYFAEFDEKKVFF